MGNNPVWEALARVDQLAPSGDLATLSELISAAERVSHGFLDLRDLYYMKGRLAYAHRNYREALEWFANADRIARNQLQDTTSARSVEVTFHLLKALAMHRPLFWRLPALGLFWRIRKFYSWDSTRHDVSAHRRLEARDILVSGARACRRIDAATAA